MKLPYLSVLTGMSLAAILSACSGAGTTGPGLSGASVSHDPLTPESSTVTPPAGSVTSAKGTWGAQGLAAPSLQPVTREDEYYDLKTNRSSLDVELHSTPTIGGTGYFKLYEDDDSLADIYNGHGYWTCEDGGAITVFNIGPPYKYDDHWIQRVGVYATHAGECTIYALDEDAPNSPVKIHVNIEK